MPCTSYTHTTPLTHRPLRFLADGRPRFRRAAPSGAASPPLHFLRTRRRWPHRPPPDRTRAQSRPRARPIHSGSAGRPTVAAARSATAQRLPPHHAASISRSSYLPAADEPLSSAPLHWTGWRRPRNLPFAAAPPQARRSTDRRLELVRRRRRTSDRRVPAAASPRPGKSVPHFNFDRRRGYAAGELGRHPKTPPSSPARPWRVLPP